MRSETTHADLRVAASRAGLPWKPASQQRMHRSLSHRHLTPVAEQVLQELALRRGISIGPVIGEALMEKKFFSDQQRGGNEVVLRSPTGHVSPVRWPYT
jgi:hypothetical protein